MGKTIECHFWDPALELDNKLDFTYEDIGNNIELKKPVFTVDALKKIMDNLKRSREEYLIKIDIPTILNVIEKVTDMWMNPDYKGRIIAREVLPTVTGFSLQMIESWGFNHFMSILRKDNLPLFGKLNPEEYKDFSELGDGLVKAYGEVNVSHSNFNPSVIGYYFNLLIRKP